MFPVPPRMPPEQACRTVLSQAQSMTGDSSGPPLACSAPRCGALPASRCLQPLCTPSSAPHRVLLSIRHDRFRVGKGHPSHSHGVSEFCADVHIHLGSRGTGRPWHWSFTALTGPRRRLTAPASGSEPCLDRKRRAGAAPDWRSLTRGGESVPRPGRDGANHRPARPLPLPRSSMCSNP